MPFKSKAQSRACYAKKSRGQAGSWDCSEWSKKTNYKKLPEKAAQNGAQPGGGQPRSLAAQLAMMAAVPAATGSINAMLAPSGSRLEGFGRGAAYGATVPFGAQLGALAGGGLGGLAGGAIGSHDGGREGMLLGAMGGMGVGGMGGALAGGYGAKKITDQLLGPGSDKYRGEEEESLPTALGKAAAKLAMTNDFTLSPTQSMLKPGPTGQGVPEYKLAPTGSPDPSRDPSETFAAAGG